MCIRDSIATVEGEEAVAQFARKGQSEVVIVADVYKRQSYHCQYLIAPFLYLFKGCCVVHFAFVRDPLPIEYATTFIVQRND